MKKLNAKEMKTFKGGATVTTTFGPACACARRCSRTAVLCQANGGTNCAEQETACLLACPNGC